MKIYLTIFTLFTIFYSFSQKESAWWPFGHQAFLNFNTQPPTLSFQSNLMFWEANSSISDENGNLLFYSNGDTIMGSNFQPIQNGTNLSPSSTSSISSTQGALFLKQPGNNNIYHFFNIPCNINNTGEFYLNHCIINQTQNNGYGAMSSSNNISNLSHGLTEKLTATKHCNNKNIWLVVIEYPFQIGNDANIPLFDLKNINFLSYLITENGLNPIPVKSPISLDHNFERSGQLKFNNKGNQLVCADPKGIDFFTFNKETGQVYFAKRILTNLENGYGIEYSPDNKLIYINEKQFDLTTNVLTKLLDSISPSQLQQSINKEIFKINLSPKFTNCYQTDNSIWFLPNNEHALKIVSIHHPNTSGLNCLYDTNYINQPQQDAFQHSISTPNFPSYYFYHPPSEFLYDKSCATDTIILYLVNNPTIDSVKWLFPNETITSSSDSISYYFGSPGTFQVGCITFSNNTSDTSFQCVDICGKNTNNILSTVDLCQFDSLVVNGLNYCSSMYHWSTGDSTASITIEKPGAYILQTTNQCGVFYDTISATKNCIESSYIFIPNVFTPNNDGDNDVFSIETSNLTNLEYIILNRWGNVVYEGKIDQPQKTCILWNGKDLKGNNCTDGVYFYKIIYNDIQNKSILKSGFVQLFNGK